MVFPDLKTVVKLLTLRHILKPVAVTSQRKTAENFGAK